MPRKSKGDPMTQNEIIAMTKEKRSSSKLYKAEVKEINDESISRSIQKAVSVMHMSEKVGKIDLNDTEREKQIVGVYIESCINESIVPSITDIACCLGHTRRNLYYYMRTNPNSNTGRFLLQIHDIIANTLADNALKGNVNPIVGIFILKSLYGFREADETVLDIMNGNGDDGGMTMEQLREKYKNLVPE